MDIEGKKPINTQRKLNRLMEKLGELGCENLTMATKNYVIKNVNFDGKVSKRKIMKLIRQFEDEPDEKIPTLSEALAASEDQFDVVKTFLLNNFGNTPMER